jgi:toxin ParE1/3/4
MSDYVLSERAKSDLLEIADYIQKRWSDILAERYIRMLFSEFSSLADKPLAGRCYDHCRVGLRGLSCGKHVISTESFLGQKYVSSGYCMRGWIFIDI